MSKISNCWGCLLGIAAFSAIASFTNSASSQQLKPIADNTLSSERSVVTPLNSHLDRIDGGAIRKANLFHSFSGFNIGENAAAYFANPSGVENILTRVTGTDPSKIFGKLGVLGNANLFLINPNGIIFGKNAQLDIHGSFIASTASAVKFADETKFSANQSQAVPLLTISVPQGLQFGGTAGGISVQGSSLVAQPGKTLALVGGDVGLDGGSLQAANGRIELGAIAGAETVGLNFSGNNLSLSFPHSVQRADVSVTNGSKIDVTDRGQGSVALTARNIDILGESRISAGIAPELTADSSRPGDVTLNATGVVTINQLSRVTNFVAANAMGNAGDINIKAGDIVINNVANAPTSETDPLSLPAALDTGSSGQGRGGNISLEATNSISLIGQDVTDNDQVISTFTGSQRSGNISLTANGSISLEKAFFVTSSFGGDAGNISLQGNKSVSLANNSSLASIAFSQGNSGNITVQSNGPVSIQNTLIASSVGAQNDPSTNPALGNAGNIEISGRSVSVTAGSEVSSRSFSGASSGNIQVNATDSVKISGAVDMSGRASLYPHLPNDRKDSIIYSALLTTSEENAREGGGSISVNTNILSVSDGAGLRAESRSNFPGGSGGSININANVVDLTGGGQLLTSAFGRGNAGNINLNVTDHISVAGSNPSATDLFNQITQIDSRSIAEGQLGSAIFASGIFANTTSDSIGKGGDVKITTEQLTIRDGAQVTVSSQGLGNAGNLTVNGRSIRLDNKATLSADKRSMSTDPNQEQARINLHTQDLILRHGSNITTNASGSKVIGGNINIDTGVLAAFENSGISANSADFRGGKVTINTKGIFRSSDSNITATGGSPELNGIVQINTLGVDPSQGLVELPTNLVESSNQILQSCSPRVGKTASRFIATGRGGLPQSPNEPLQGPAVITGWVSLEEDSENPMGDDTRHTSAATQTQRYSGTSFHFATAATQIVEANGWVVDKNGDIYLIAKSPDTPHSSGLLRASCPQ